MNNIFIRLLDGFYDHDNDDQPIISENVLVDFFSRSLKHSKTLNKQPLSDGRLHGDKLSPFNGPGLDYSESRNYAHGDDLRAINWKQSARSQTLVTNKYYFENESIDYLVIDCRYNMLFGTRYQPKIAIAIKVAITSAISSLSNHRIVRLIELSDHINTSVNLGSYQEALLYFKKITEFGFSEKQQRQPDITAALTYLSSKKPVNSTITLISDFHDLNQNDMPLIKFNEQNNVVKVYKINDDIEYDLPAIYPVNYQSVFDDYSVTVNNRSQHLEIKTQLSAKNEKIVALLNQLRKTPYFILNNITDETILELQAAR